MDRRTLLASGLALAAAAPLRAQVPAPTKAAQRLPLWPKGVPGGAYVGPSRRMETIGPPKLTKGSKQSRDETAARRLWEVSEQLTDVHYAFAAPAVS